MTFRAVAPLIFIVLAFAAPAHAQTAPGDAQKIERGRVVYQYWCATCHSAGRGMPGTAALAVKYKGQPNTPAVLAERQRPQKRTFRSA
jgi:mono/diheme cytochrome c family protein